jgi:hypothetical protein
VAEDPEEALRRARRAVAKATGRLRELGRLPGRVRQAYQEGRGETEVDGPDPS